MCHSQSNKNFQILTDQNSAFSQNRGPEDLIMHPQMTLFCTFQSAHYYYFLLALVMSLAIFHKAKRPMICSANINFGLNNLVLQHMSLNPNCKLCNVFQILLLNTLWCRKNGEQCLQILRNTTYLFSRQWSLYSSSTFLNIVTANKPLSASSVRSLQQQWTKNNHCNILE